MMGLQELSFSRIQDKVICITSEADNHVTHMIGKSALTRSHPIAKAQGKLPRLA